VKPAQLLCRLRLQFYPVQLRKADVQTSNHPFRRPAGAYQWAAEQESPSNLHRCAGEAFNEYFEESFKSFIEKLCQCSTAELWETPALVPTDKLGTPMPASPPHTQNMEVAKQCTAKRAWLRHASH
jgi:hypothetical protein